MDDTLLGAETDWICSQARDLGFALCGVAAAERFPELGRYEEWLERGYAGEMAYLKNPRRLNPQDVMTAARSLIVCALNYNTKLPYSVEVCAGCEDGETPRGWISRYAWGDDYHEVLWAKLNALIAKMKEHFPESFEARAFADTGPIHERAAAKYAGLGWLGKNTLLINQAAGSWLFLGVIATSLALQPTLGPADAPAADRCGTCRACLDACPTQAIVEPYVLDATRCISYLTIELRGSIAENLREAMGAHVFGCDICQDVCPWNRKAPVGNLPEFQPRRLSPENDRNQEKETLYDPALLRLAGLTEAEFREIFRRSPIKRTKWRGLIRNACIALGNARISAGHPWYEPVCEMLQELSCSAEEAIAESAQWALSRIQRRDHRPDGPQAVAS